MTNPFENSAAAYLVLVNDELADVYEQTPGSHTVYYFRVGLGSWSR